MASNEEINESVTNSHIGPNATQDFPVPACSKLSETPTPLSPTPPPLHELPQPLFGSSITEIAIAPTARHPLQATNSLASDNRVDYYVLNQYSRPATEASAPVSRTFPLLDPTEEQEHGAYPQYGNEIHRMEITQDPNLLLDQTAGFWERYNRAADFEDREFVKAAGGDLDTLLIFAGLFSGVNTAFILESMKTVQPDQAAKTNDLIRSVILILQNTTTSENLLHNAPFAPSAQNVRSTAMFFASLSCSLAAAFGAVLGKQWLNYYEREGALKPPPGRGRERQKKYEGRAQWHLEGVIETLPTVLQISLFLFLSALVDFLWPINRTSGEVVLGFSLGLVCFYVITTTIATIYPLAPFQTRLSTVLRAAIHKSLAPMTMVKGALWKLITLPFVELVEMVRAHHLLQNVPPVLGIACFIMIALVVLPPYMLWRFANIALRTVLKFTRRRFALHASSYPHPARHFIGDAESKELIQGMRCMTFYARRASAPEDREQLFAAMDTLPPDLELDPYNSALTLLGETLIKFVIKPTGTWKKCDTSLTASDFQYLLKPLHLLYSSWKHLDDPESNPPSSPFFGTCSIMVWRKLWDVVASGPNSYMTASLIADIFDLPIYSWGRPADFCKKSTFIQKSLISSILEKKDNLPYIRLLAASMTTHPQRQFPDQTDTTKLVPIVLATLKKSIDVENVPQIAWAELLPDHLGESQLDLGFSKYLTTCCKSYSYGRVSNQPGWAGRNRDMFSGDAQLFCLRAVYKLVHRGSSLWLQTLEEEGFPSLLLQFPHSNRHWPNVIGLSLLSFVSLWHARRALSTAMTHQAPEYLTSDSVAIIASKLWMIGQIRYTHLQGIEEKCISQSMERIVEYFEEASRLGLLKHGMEAVIGRYQWEGYCHELIEQELRMELYARLERLVYI